MSAIQTSNTPFANPTFVPRAVRIQMKPRFSPAAVNACVEASIIAAFQKKKEESEQPKTAVPAATTAVASQPMMVMTRHVATVLTLKLEQQHFQTFLFSQRNIGSRTQDGIPLAALAHTIVTRGFQPTSAIHAIALSNIMVTFDNRRLYASLTSVTKTTSVGIYVLRHLPTDFRDNRDLKMHLENALSMKKDKSENAQKWFALPTGVGANTWAEAIILRLRSAYEVTLQDLEGRVGFKYSEVVVRG